jgi:hypothetical protein
MKFRVLRSEEKRSRLRHLNRKITLDCIQLEKDSISFTNYGSRLQALACMGMSFEFYKWLGNA